MLDKIKQLLNDPIGRLRIAGFLEGTSLLLLLFVAMPLKYIWQQPVMVKIVGSAHGFLFLLFVGWVVYAGVARAWPFWSKTLPLVISSFVPFGTFYMDKKVLKGEMIEDRR